MRRLLAPVLSLLLVGCSTPSGLGHYFQPDVYTVVRGDTLYSIAWRYQLDHEDLARWNGLAAPFRIKPGQKLTLAPSVDDDAPAGIATGAGSVADTAAVRTEPASGASPTVETAPPPKAEPPPQDLAPRRWVWPAKGRVINGFVHGDPARKGLDIGGKEGEPVLAAAAGRVVYSGNGLPAYGNLVIVRHSDLYLSAYAHNRELLVTEGDSVTQGQPIAYMGLSEDREPLLHFEIRKNGQPLDPITVLPPR